MRIVWTILILILIKESEIWAEIRRRLSLSFVVSRAYWMDEQKRGKVKGIRVRIKEKENKEKNSYTWNISFNCFGRLTPEVTFASSAHQKFELFNAFLDFLSGGGEHLSIRMEASWGSRERSQVEWEWWKCLCGRFTGIKLKKWRNNLNCGEIPWKS